MLKLTAYAVTGFFLVVYPALQVLQGIANLTGRVL